MPTIKLSDAQYKKILSESSTLRKLRETVEGPPPEIQRLLDKFKNFNEKYGDITISPENIELDDDEAILKFRKFEIKNMSPVLEIQPFDQGRSPVFIKLTLPKGDYKEYSKFSGDVVDEEGYYAVSGYVGTFLHDVGNVSSAYDGSTLTVFIGSLDYPKYKDYIKSANISIYNGL